MNYEEYRRNLLWGWVFVVLMVVLLALVVTLPAEGTAPDNGDRIHTGRSDGLIWHIYAALDAEEDAVAEGAAIYVGGWTALTVFPTVGVDGGDTWSVDCSISGGEHVTPVNWDEVLAENSGMEGYAMPQGHACEWIRVNKPTDTDDATTVLVMVVRPVQP